MIKVYNKNTKTTSFVYFTPLSSVFIDDFEQVKISWVGMSSN